ncbi:hypothetical protein FRC07_000688 [Ceratobasidium sp. 392]|nr:hypothetical protein FRC07_000688 [Ceratobasidium sp. 392]
MPSRGNFVLSYDICVHTTAVDFLEATEHVLLEHERRSNLILAHALERARWEARHIGLGAAAATAGLAPRERSAAWWARRHSGGQPNLEVGRDFWVSVWTVHVPVASASSRSFTPNSLPPRPPTLDFAVSILGSDPVFVFTPHPPSTLSVPFLSPRIGPLVMSLAQIMPIERMSRVFALFSVAECITETWTAHTGAQRAPESQCNVFSTFCTVATFAGAQPLPDGDRVLLAEKRHTAQLVQMYYDYEREMLIPPQVLHPVSHDFARLKVEQMIQQGQLWVYEYPVLNAARTRVEYYEVTAMAALVRDTPAVAALSTIYTSPRLRGNRFAEKLVGRVCNHVFAMNKSAVLFVPGGNTAASNLLGRIGFYGMGARALTLGEEAETWREIGFANGVRVSGSW